SVSFPVDLRVIDCVAVESRATSPKGIDEELRFNSNSSPFSFKAKVVELPPPLAVRVAICVVNPVAILVENATVVAPAGTTIDFGTVASPLLLFNATLSPLEPAGAVSVTV